LDVLHDPADEGALAVADAVDVDLDGRLQELVDQHGLAGGDLHGVPDVAGQPGLVVDDLHASAAQDVAGPDQHGVADVPGGADAALEVQGGAGGRLAQPELGDEGAEALAVLGGVDGVDAGADDGGAGGLEGAGEVEGGLPAELDDQPPGAHAVADVEDVLDGQGLEEEVVGGVVVGGDGFGVGVDHDGLEPRLPEG